jgi:hypothetical protein
VGAQHGWQLLVQRRQDGTAGPVRPGPGHLTAEHHDLMAQHHDLGIEVLLISRKACVQRPRMRCSRSEISE